MDSAKPRSTALPLAVAIVIALLPAVGCVPRTGYQPPPQPAEMLQGQEYFLRGDYGRAADAFRLCASRYSGQQAAEGYYWLGVCRLKQERLHTAEQAFRDCLRQRPRGTLELNAWIGIADCYRIAQRFELAASVYERVLATGSVEIERDLIAFNQGLCLLRAGKKDRAGAVLQRLVSEHPAGPYAAAAREKLGLASCFFVQAGAFADRANADRLAARLREKGFVPRIEKCSSSHCVRVGHESTWEGAVALAARLRAAGFDAACMP